MASLAPKGTFFVVVKLTEGPTEFFLDKFGKLTAFEMEAHAYPSREAQFASRIIQNFGVVESTGLRREIGKWMVERKGGGA